MAAPAVQAALEATAVRVHCCWVAAAMVVPVGLVVQVVRVAREPMEPTRWWPVAAEVRAAPAVEEAPVVSAAMADRPGMAGCCCCSAARAAMVTAVRAVTVVPAGSLATAAMAPAGMARTRMAVAVVTVAILEPLAWVAPAAPLAVRVAIPGLLARQGR
jgi:hypothetical protein